MANLPSPQPDRGRPKRRGSVWRAGVLGALLFDSFACAGSARAQADPVQPAPAEAVVTPAAQNHVDGGSGSPSAVRARETAPASGAASVNEPAVDHDPRRALDDEPSLQSATLLWRAGASLAAAPAIGPDGAIYIASRQGTLDVLEASGNHRFTITLGGAPTGAVFVDERGWIFVGLATGKLLGINPLGVQSFAFQAPKGIRGGVAFAEGQGLLITGYDDVIVGVNRGGFPTMRVDVHGQLTAGPIGILGWCVVGTAKGEILWGDRWGKRRHVELGTALRDLQPTTMGGIWGLSENGLSAFSPKRELEFRRDAALAIATAPRGADGFGLQGALLTSDYELEWLDGRGNAIARRQLELQDGASLPILRLDTEGKLWIVSPAGTLRVLGPHGGDEPPRQFKSRALLEPVFDASRRRTIVATAEGEVYGLNWRGRE